MNQFMNNLRRFMYGRYGFDKLSQALIVLSLILTLISSFSGSLVITILSYLPLICAIFRILSKNIQMRARENMIYTGFAQTTKTKLRNLKWILVGTKTHKYFVCSNCRQLIRIPRGKGKICITCPKCKKEFVKNT